MLALTGLSGTLSRLDSAALSSFNLVMNEVFDRIRGDNFGMMRGSRQHSPSGYFTSCFGNLHVPALQRFSPSDDDPSLLRPLLAPPFLEFLFILLLILWNAALTRFPKSSRVAKSVWLDLSVF